MHQRALLRLIHHVPQKLSVVSRRSNSTKSTLSDPYPLPLSSSTIYSQSPTSHTSLPPRLPRSKENIQTLRARLVYQSRKRGTLEADLLLSTFANEQLGEMNEEELKEFDRFMDEPDWDIYYWTVGKREPPTRWADSDLLLKLKKHAANEGKVVRRMPDLASAESR